ncbi:sensor histidine kinase [Marivita sp. S0852]|uniref:sensor histidine kinase n=1 Tax=Marivita sp. S0852 TaxID=3373893 RepID=UPI0039821502
MFEYQKHAAIPDDLGEILGIGLEAMPFAALLFRPDDDLTLLWRNTEHAKMSGSLGLDITGRAMFDAFPPSADSDASEATNYIREAVRNILNSGDPQETGPARFDLLNDEGQYVEHYWQMHFSPIRKAGDIVAILQTAQNVTDATLQERLAQSHRRAATFSASVAYFSFDPQTDLFERHEAIDAMFGFEPGEAGPYATPFFAKVHPDDLEAVNAEVTRVMGAPEGEIASFDYRVPMPDGTQRFLRIRGEMATDPVDRRSKLVGTFVDLTDIENARLDLEHAVRARTSLMEEANHRIKNSLQIAMSLLRLQARTLMSDDSPAAERAKAALSAVEARVRAVSDVHAAIQIDGHEAKTDLIALFSRLVSFTRKSSEHSEATLRFDAPDIPVFVKSDTAVALGLVINELLTNAIKHGQPSKEAPVTMTLFQAANDQIEIVVENRHGLGSTAFEIDSSGIGERLVQQFADQIGATVERTQDATRYTARIILPPEV